MKKVVSRECLYEKMTEAINLLCDTVKSTLGPKGSNAIIDHSAFSPFITNDGVTIASQIESEDAVINTILELAKEASIKTNQVVGDGTTTTLVYLQKIYNLGRKAIEDGANPMILKKELDNALKQVIPLIKKESWQPKKDEIEQIANVSASSKEIGKNITKAFLKVKAKDAITIKEGDNFQDEILFKNGYVLETVLASPYFFNAKEINYTNPQVLIINEVLDDLEAIAPFINHAMEEKEPLIIWVEDVSDDVLNEILNLYLQENVAIVLLKIPGYGQEKLLILKDLITLSDAKRIDNYVLGKVQQIKINEEETIITTDSNLKLQKTEISEKSKAMLEKGLVEIKVGALTETERKEKKMRYDDALSAIALAIHGVVMGGGLTTLKIASLMSINTIGDKILQESLQEPFKQILINAGEDTETFTKEIMNSNYEKIYNVNTSKLEDIRESKIIDPVDVAISALSNAISIAGMLLTTTSLIINEYPNNILKENSFTDM